MRQAALDWARRVYAKRVCNMAPPETNRYHGDFDFGWIEYLSTPSSSNLNEHRACWQEFHRDFSQRWSEHSDGI